MFRIGIGQDSHKFVAQNDKKPLILGGVVVHGETGLKGDSDSDAFLHALFNALSSAVGKESLGFYADPLRLEKGIIDGQEYLKIALELVNQAGFKVNNISLTVETKKPRFPQQLTSKIREKIGSLCKVSASCVGITATSGDGLTTFAKGEGMQVFAIVSLISKDE